ncbi:HEAT repeat domain-containing protein [Candidatus Neomarinimicrobiota bacterium]
MIKELEHKNSDVRAEAAEILGEIGDVRAVNPLIAAVVNDDNNKNVIINAANAIIKIDTVAVEPLIKALGDDNHKIRSFAAAALGEIGDIRAVEPLIAALKNDYQVDEVAAIALGKIGDVRAVEPLTFAALKDDNEYRRADAAEALGRFSNDAPKALIEALNDNDAIIRTNAALAMGKIGDKQAIPHLIDLLSNWYVGKDAAHALNTLGWMPESTSDYIHLFVTQRNGIKLKSMWEGTKRVLLEDMYSDKENSIKNALFAFVAIGKQEIIPELINILNNKGTKATATAYLNCGNEELSKAAKSWAKKHGYFIMQSPGGSSNVSWGSW